MTVMEWIGVPFALFGKLVTFLLKNKILLIAVVALVVILGVMRMFNKPTPPTNQQIMASTAPTTRQAPTMITTSTGQFYVKSFTDDGIILLLTKFYSYESSKWIYEQKIPLQLDRTVDKNIKITKR